jgi:hypothetical protein
MTDSDVCDRDYSLFNNPMINQAKQALSAKDIERYEEWGHAVFDDMDYESTAVTKYPPPMLNAIVYIEDSLKSGQHPSTLTKDELALLNEMKGEKWYENWGYTKEDLDDIVNVKVDTVNK